MPTSRPRHVVTETDRVAAALAVAAERWPEDAEHRGRLLLRLIEEGRKAVGQDRQDEHEQRVRRLRSANGSLAGVFDPGFLQGLREDWPA